MDALQYKYKVFTHQVGGTRKLYNYSDNFQEFALNETKKNPKKEAYESIFIYTDAAKEQNDKINSLSGVKDVITDRIIFDFDHKQELDIALFSARTLVNNLIKQGVDKDAIRIYFSGNKGYHVEMVLDDEYITQPQFKTLVYNLASGLEGFDLSINDPNRVFRSPLSYNAKSKKYKYPIPIDQFLDEDLTSEEFAFSDYAQNPFGKEAYKDITELMKNYKKIKIPETLKPMMITEEKQKTSTEMTIEPSGEKPDMTHKPKHLSEAKYALMLGFFEEGERHHACMIMAATFRALGYPKEVSYNMLKSMVRLRNRRLGLPEEVLDDTKTDLWTEVSSVYSPTWTGATYSEKDGLLAKTIQLYELNKTADQEFGLVEIKDIADHFKDFAVNIDKNTIKLGIEEIDNKVRITTSMFVCLLAPPSAGKTSVAFGVLNAISKNNEKAIFFSMDMAIPQIYQRLIQRETGDEESTIMKNYQEGNAAKIEEYQNILNQEFKNVKFCFRTGVTTDNIRNSIIAEIDKMGVKPRLVVIDYLECIAGPFSDPTANKALIATQLKDIANELGVCIFLLVQPAKISGDPSHELTSYTQIKGSSVLGEAATIVMAMYRPGFSPKTPQDDKFLTINVVKNRMGKLSSTDLHWHGLTGRLRQLQDEERVELEQIRERKAIEASGGTNEYIQGGKFVPKSRGDLY